MSPCFREFKLPELKRGLAGRSTSIVPLSRRRVEGAKISGLYAPVLHRYCGAVEARSPHWIPLVSSRIGLLEFGTGKILSNFVSLERHFDRHLNKILWFSLIVFRILGFPYVRTQVRGQIFQHQGHAAGHRGCYE